MSRKGQNKDRSGKRFLVQFETVGNPEMDGRSPKFDLGRPEETLEATKASSFLTTIFATAERMCRVGKIRQNKGLKSISSLL